MYTYALRGVMSQQEKPPTGYYWMAVVTLQMLSAKTSTQLIDP